MVFAEEGIQACQTIKWAQFSDGWLWVTRCPCREPRNSCPLEEPLSHHSSPCLGFFFFFKIYFALLSVWVSVYIWVCTLVGMPVMSRGGLQMAWSWNYKHLWVPEIELWSSKRVVNNLKCWAISPSSSFNRFYCLKSVLLVLSFCVWLNKSMCIHGNVVTLGGQKY